MIFFRSKWFSIFLFIFSTGIGSSQNLDWAKTMGSSQFDTGSDIAVDDSGNVYTTGYFQDVVDFDPGPGNLNVGSAGGDNIFILKQDYQGDVVWAKSLNGNSTFNWGRAIDVDNLGNVYVAGYFSDSLDADPGPGTLYFHTWLINSFVIKLDPNGNLLWAADFGGSAYTLGRDLDVDSLGNVFFAGSFIGTADFDPSPGVTNLSSANSASQNPDGFFLKLNSSGGLTWVKPLTGNGNEVINDIDVTNSGDFYLAGNSQGAGFIAKCNSSGDTLWFKSMYDECLDVEVDRFGHSYSVCRVSHFGFLYNVIVKLDTLRTVKWENYTSSMFLKSCALDPYGNVYTVGNFFVPPAGVSSAGGNEVIIYKHDSTGTLNWIGAFGGSSNDHGDAIAIDSYQNIYLTGNFEDTADFDPDTSAVLNLPSVGDADIFVEKLRNPCNPFIDSLSAEGCKTYLSPSSRYSWNTSGIYYDTIVSVLSCDTIKVVDLTIVDSTDITSNISVCDSFTSPLNQVYTASGNYIYGYTMPSGCYATVNLNLTIKQSDYIIDSIETCDDYLWPLTQQTYSTSDTYVYNGSKMNGCDSVVELNLSIVHIDTTISRVNNSLTAMETGAAYQWMDCTNGIILANDTSRVFIPTANGSYAVIISKGNCMDTSACMVVDDISLKNYELAVIEIFPNPTDGTISIRNTNGEPLGRISLYNSSGAKMKTDFISSSSLNYTIHGSKGLYLLYFFSPDGNYEVIRVLKK